MSDTVGMNVVVTDPVGSSELKNRGDRGSTGRSVWLTVLLIIVAMLVSSGCLSERVESTAFVRLSGDNRYATSAGVMQAFCVAECPETINVVVTTGANFPDGLSAASLGHVVLTTSPTGLPTEITSTLGDLISTDPCPSVASVGLCYGGHKIGTIFIIGGISAVSESVAAELAGFGSVQRIAGQNRYSTALAVAEEVTLGTPRTAIIATGLNFPDALAAGPLSICAKAPILLNAGSTARADIAKFLSDKSIEKVYIVGGPAVIPQSVIASLPAGVTTVKRLSGNGRAGTAVAIANEIASPIGCGRTPIGVTLVNCNGFADALSAGPLASKALSPILCVNNDGIPAETKVYLDTFKTVTGSTTPIIGIGGENAIPQSVLDGANAAVNANNTGDALVGPGILFATQSTKQLSPGITELTVTAVFNRLQIRATPEFDVFADSAATAPLGLTLGSSTLVPTDLRYMALTNVYTTDDSSMVPVVGTGEVRIAIGKASDVGGTSNATVRTARIMACNPTDILFRACQATGVSSLTPEDTIRPDATIEMSMYARSIKVTFSEPVTAATAGNIENYVTTSGLYQSNGVVLDYPLNVTGVELAGNVATVTVNRPIESQDTFYVKSGVIADLATPPNFYSKLNPADGPNPGLPVLSRPSVTGLGEFAFLSFNNGGIEQSGNYLTIWNFSFTKEPGQCVFTVAVTRGGVEQLQTVTEPHFDSKCAPKFALFGDETLIRAVSLTVNGVAMDTSGFHPDGPPFK